jgi:hypothetical protein
MAPWKIADLFAKLTAVAQAAAARFDYGLAERCWAQKVATVV